MVAYTNLGSGEQQQTDFKADCRHMTNTRDQHHENRTEAVRGNNNISKSLVDSFCILVKFRSIFSTLHFGFLVSELGL